MSIVKSRFAQRAQWWAHTPLLPAVAAQALYLVASAERLPDAGGEKSGRAARVAGEEQHEMVFKSVQALVRQRERRNLDLPLLVDVEARNAAERGDVLVLLADRLLEQVELDVTGLLSQLARRDRVAPHGMERAQERGRLAAPTQVPRLQLYGRKDAKASNRA